MTTQDMEIPTTATDIAKVAQASFDRVVEVFMAALDLCEHAQQEHRAIQFDRLRLVICREGRLADAMHASAVGDLLDCVDGDDHQEYGDELTAYGDELMANLPEIPEEAKPGNSDNQEDQPA